MVLSIHIPCKVNQKNEICKRDFSSKYYLKIHKNNCHGNISHQNGDIVNDAQGEISIEIQDVWSIGGDDSKKSESPESSEGKRLRTVFTKVSKKNIFICFRARCS